MLKQTIWKTTCAPKTSRFGRLITDWLVENMSPDMTSYRMLLDGSISQRNKIQ
jgi:hypothetical protein